MLLFNPKWSGWRCMLKMSVFSTSLPHLWRRQPRRLHRSSPQPWPVYPREQAPGSPLVREQHACGANSLPVKWQLEGFCRFEWLMRPARPLALCKYFLCNVLKFSFVRLQESRQVRCCLRYLAKLYPLASQVLHHGQNTQRNIWNDYAPMYIWMYFRQLRTTSTRVLL